MEHSSYSASNSTSGGQKKKIPSFFGTRKIITVFKTARHKTLS
jgi:hypothetical protein